MIILTISTFPPPCKDLNWWRPPFTNLIASEPNNWSIKIPNLQMPSTATEEERERERGRRPTKGRFYLMLKSNGNLKVKKSLNFADVIYGSPLTKTYLIGFSSTLTDPFEVVLTLMVFSATQPVLGIESTAAAWLADLNVCVARMPDVLLQL